MGLLQKTRTQAGFLCECSGNIELHLAAKSLKYRFPSTVRGLRETVYECYPVVVASTLGHFCKPSTMLRKKKNPISLAMDRLFAMPV